MFVSLTKLVRFSANLVCFNHSRPVSNLGLLCLPAVFTFHKWYHSSIFITRSSRVGTTRLHSMLSHATWVLQNAYIEVKANLAGYRSKVPIVWQVRLQRSSSCYSQLSYEILSICTAVELRSFFSSCPRAIYLSWSKISRCETPVWYYHCSRNTR